MGLFTKDIATLHDLFVHQLQDIYYAENQIAKALPKMIDKATNQELRAGFEMHLRETEVQIDRLEQAFASIGEKVKAVNCPAIDGVIKEANEIFGDVADKQVLDAALIASAQAVEHYEITRYGTLIAWGEQMGHTAAVRLFQETLEEERATTTSSPRWRGERLIPPRTWPRPDRHCSAAGRRRSGHAIVRGPRPPAKATRRARAGRGTCEARPQAEGGSNGRASATAASRRRIAARRVHAVRCSGHEPRISPHDGRGTFASRNALPRLMTKCLKRVAIAAATLVAFGAGPLTAASPPNGGSISIEATAEPNTASRAMPAFVNATSEALAARGFTILEDPGHSAYVPSCPSAARKSARDRPRSRPAGERSRPAPMAASGLASRSRSRRASPSSSHWSALSSNCVSAGGARMPWYGTAPP